MAPVFLTTEDVLEIHRDQIKRYGGPSGIRDLLLLQSAVAQPSTTFEGQCLHSDIFEMAAAYLFHIVMNHPFIDGNKRTGAAAAVVFLFINGVRVKMEEDTLAEMVLSVTEGKLDKSGIAALLEAACAQPE